jgi:2-polyprenyl-6-methoxyphenol hydroxylase-like FAD-dependent oxidoreductase
MRTAQSRGTALVIGCGVAGTAAAAVLARHFDRVRVIEQDALATTAALRKSLPQASHAHALLHAGHRALSQIFPGFEQAAVEAGSLRLAVRSQWRSCLRGRWVDPEDSGLHVLSQTRPLLDQVLRNRLTGVPGVEVIQAKVIGLLRGASGSISGLRTIQNGSETSLDADLVVDASGRAGQSDRWLAEIGAAVPRIDTAFPEVRYVTAEFTRTVADGPRFAGWLNLATAPQSRGAVLAPVELDRWIVTASTRFGETPPDSEPAFRSFLDGLGDGRVGPLLAGERLVGGFSRYRIAATRLKRFDLDVTTLPPGYLPIGDAIASFNPIYGQGMSVAALQVLALANTLEETMPSGIDALRLREAYLARAFRPALWAWRLGLASDMDFAAFRFTPDEQAVRLHRSLRRAFLVSTRDPEVRAGVDHILHLMAPPESVFDLPAIAADQTPFLATAASRPVFEKGTTA